MRALLIAAALLASGAAEAYEPVTAYEKAFAECRMTTITVKIDSNLVGQFIEDCMILKGFRLGEKPEPFMIPTEPKGTVNKQSVDEFLKTFEPKF